MLFLIEYDRKQGKLLSLEAFEATAEALVQARRLEKEIKRRSNLR